MDGKASAHEPLKDLMLLLSILSGASGTSVLVPNFYHGIPELTEEEMRQYSEITSTLMPGHPEIKDADSFTQSLVQRWREPNLTIHRVDVPESKTAVTIPRFAEATLSIRIVPGQDADEIAADLISFARKEFRGLRSMNKLEIRISSLADAWLGDPSNEIFQALESAITRVWTPDATSFEVLPQRSFSTQGENKKFTPPPSPSPIQASPPSHSHRRASTLASKGSFNAENIPRKPLYIREGGSIPAISFLEREFGAPAAMFPMGQASDNAHLGNERMRVENLYKGREVFKKVFAQL
jgi:di- and tripeptidase